MYPETAKRLAPYVEEMCDRLEYEGGILYDEYPDRFLLQKHGKDMADKIRKKYRDEKESPLWKIKDWDGFEEIVMLLLHEEILKRRHRKNRGYLRF